MAKIIPFESDPDPEGNPPDETCVVRYLDGREAEEMLPGPFRSGVNRFLSDDSGTTGLVHEGEDAQGRHILVEVAGRS